MAIQVHNARNQIAGAFTGALYRWGSRVGNDALRELTDALVDDVVIGGAEALDGLRNSVAQWIQRNSDSLGNRAWHVGEMMRDAVQTVWQDNQQAWGPLIYGEEHNQLANTEEHQMTNYDPENAIPEYAMESASEVPQIEALAARSSAPGGGPSAVSKETPISPYPNLSYGLQETHTTVLPWTGYISVAGIDKTTPAQLRLRMNAVWDMIDVTTGTSPAAGAVFPSKGFYSKMVNGDGKASAVAFPETFADAASTANERPQWRDYWSTYYDWYTVLGCEYKIILQNPIKTAGADVICGWQMDTYSAASGSTGNVMPQAQFAEVKYFKNIQWTSIGPQNNSEKNPNIAIIEGKYKPGQAKRNITNDGDVKTWTATGAALPNLNEILTLNFWRAPMAYEEMQSAVYGLNMQIELKYIVQFKDLKVQARYPNTLITNQPLVTTLNENPLATGTAHHVRQY